MSEAAINKSIKNRVIVQKRKEGKEAIPNPQAPKKSSRSVRDISPMMNPLLIAKMLTTEDVFKPKKLKQVQANSRK